MAGAERPRVVAVLGYSDRRRSGLHPLAAARLRHAEAVADGAVAVVLSGWTRHGGEVAEAELMRDAWEGPAIELVCDADARNTAENAAGIAAAAHALDADELTIVTSRWHAPRARILIRAALDDPNVAVHTSSPGGSFHPRLIVRELVCFASLPWQLRRLRRRLGRGTTDPSSTGGEQRSTR